MLTNNIILTISRHEPLRLIGINTIHGGLKLSRCKIKNRGWDEHVNLFGMPRGAKMSLALHEPI